MEKNGLKHAMFNGFKDECICIKYFSVKYSYIGLRQEKMLKKNIFCSGFLKVLNWNRHKGCGVGHVWYYFIKCLLPLFYIHICKCNISEKEMPPQSCNHPCRLVILLCCFDKAIIVYARPQNSDLVTSVVKGMSTLRKEQKTPSLNITRSVSWLAAGELC